jgi:hypothetical protein
VKTATEEAIQLDRMIGRAVLIWADLSTRCLREPSNRKAAQLLRRMRIAGRRLDTLVDLRDSATIPTR